MKLPLLIFGGLVLATGVAFIGGAVYVIMTSVDIKWLESLIAIIAGFVALAIGGIMMGRYMTNSTRFILMIFGGLLVMILGLAMMGFGVWTILTSANPKFFESLVAIITGVMTLIYGFSNINKKPHPAEDD